jgi:hypothetical protein
MGASRRVTKEDRVQEGLGQLPRDHKRGRALKPGTDTVKSHPGLYSRHGARRKNTCKLLNCPFSAAFSLTCWAGQVEIPG